MKPEVKVVGLVQAKNEWPLLALSVSHALMNHVHEVYVLNHGSTDGSVEGLRDLQRLWKNRIQVLNCYDEHYWQEASINALIAVSQRSSPDWVYVFDADEFLLTDSSESLKDILNNIDPQYSVVRYEVQNWISTEDFDEGNLDNYRALKYRSVASLFLDMSPATYVDEIWNGNLNFYDIPFPSKVIFKNNRVFWLKAGAHDVRADSDIPTLNLPADRLRAAHFPLLTRKRLDMKAEHGQQLIKDGFPAAHGWQNQLIYRFSQEKILNQFWESHTVTPDNKWNRTMPSWVLDDIFLEEIAPVLTLLQHKLDAFTFRSESEHTSSIQRSDTAIPFRTVVSLTRTFQLIADSIPVKQAKIIGERDAAIMERDTLIPDKEGLHCPAKRATVSVIIPFYNGSKFIERSLKSVINQTVPADELIVVNDGSNKEERLFLYDLAKDYPFRIIEQENEGQGSARNSGVSASKSEFICFLDQDDYFLDDHIEVLIKSLPCEDRRLGFVYADLQRIDSEGKIILSSLVKESSPSNPKRSLIDCLGSDMFVLPSASIIRREAFETVGGFDTQFRGYEDDDLFLRMFQKGFTNYYVDRPVTVWCSNSESTSFSVHMAHSRLKYFKKLASSFPDDPGLDLYFVRDCIVPRFSRLFVAEAISIATKKLAHRCEAARILREYASLVCGNPHISMAYKLRLWLVVLALSWFPAWLIPLAALAIRLPVLRSLVIL